jgi:four helix bundle protein
MNNFRKLKIWQNAVQFATEIYQMTNSYPSHEKYGLVSQIRRSVVSISSNIAEGAGRKGTKEFCHFLRIAYGSACEVETQLIISKNLKFIQKDQFDELFQMCDELQKMIYVLQRNLSGEE